EAHVTALKKRTPETGGLIAGNREHSTATPQLPGNSPGYLKADPNVDGLGSLLADQCSLGGVRKHIDVEVLQGGESLCWASGARKNLCVVGHFYPASIYPA